MVVSYYLFSIVMLILIIFLIRSFVLRRNNVPVKLFLEALKDENSGHFEEAVITYKSALVAIKKSRVHRYLKIKITDKLKVLHTIIEYKNSLRIVR